jgi:hypothetical protein
MQAQLSLFNFPANCWRLRYAAIKIMLHPNPTLPPRCQKQSGP